MAYRSACLAGASRFEALLLNHRRRLHDAIVLVNVPHTLLSADNRAALRAVGSSPRSCFTECELDEQGGKTGCAAKELGCLVHRSFFMLLVLDKVLRARVRLGLAGPLKIVDLLGPLRTWDRATDYFCPR